MPSTLVRFPLGLRRVIASHILLWWQNWASKKSRIRGEHTYKPIRSNMDIRPQVSRQSRSPRSRPVHHDGFWLLEYVINDVERGRYSGLLNIGTLQGEYLRRDINSLREMWNLKPMEYETEPKHFSLAGNFHTHLGVGGCNGHGGTASRAVPRRRS